MTMEVPPQDVITRDNVSIKVSAVLYFRVIDPNRAVTEVQNYLFATSQLAQVTLRSICGQALLDELLAEREKINTRIQEILDLQTEPWGVKVVLVEVKDIDLPQEMQRAMPPMSAFPSRAPSMLPKRRRILFYSKKIWAFLCRVCVKGGRPLRTH